MRPMMPVQATWSRIEFKGLEFGIPTCEFDRYSGVSMRNEWTSSASGDSLTLEGVAAERLGHDGFT